MMCMHRDDRAHSIGHAGLSSTSVQNIEDRNMAPTFCNAGLVSTSVWHSLRMKRWHLADNAKRMTHAGLSSTSAHAIRDKNMSPTVCNAGLISTSVRHSSSAPVLNILFEPKWPRDYNHPINPIPSDPTRPDPVRSGPIRSDPIRSDPIRSDPI